MSKVPRDGRQPVVYKNWNDTCTISSSVSFKCPRIPLEEMLSTLCVLHFAVLESLTLTTILLSLIAPMGLSTILLTKVTLVLAHLWLHHLSYCQLFIRYKLCLIKGNSISFLAAWPNSIGTLEFQAVKRLSGMGIRFAIHLHATGRLILSTCERCSGMSVWTLRLEACSSWEVPISPLKSFFRPYSTSMRQVLKSLWGNWNKIFVGSWKEQYEIKDKEREIWNLKYMKAFSYQTHFDFRFLSSLLTCIQSCFYHFSWSKSVFSFINVIPDLVSDEVEYCMSKVLTS